jgi:hypothetical protein
MSLVLTQMIIRYGINKITQTKTINRIFVVEGLPIIERMKNAKGGVISTDERNQIIPLLFMRFAYIATGIAKTIKTNKKEIPITIAVIRFLFLHGFNLFPLQLSPKASSMTSFIFFLSQHETALSLLR